MGRRRLPSTLAQLRVTQQSWEEGYLAGEVSASQFCWQFEWHFRRGELLVEPSLGRALIRDALFRYLRQQDYQLEPGGDYSFTIRAQF